MLLGNGEGVVGQVDETCLISSRADLLGGGEEVRHSERGDDGEHCERGHHLNDSEAADGQSSSNGA